MSIGNSEPAADCSLCPRLAGFLAETRLQHPDWFNRPVPSFGDPAAEFLVMGLAPGITGANRTGRPFTGDFAGDLLYSTLAKFGFSEGTYDQRPDDGLKLVNCLISNAVRCVPPQNKPTTIEINTCRRFLSMQIAALPDLKVILALGKVAHDSVVSSFGHKKSAFKFGHNAVHVVMDSITLVDSYHCSRYNTNTGRLTVQMFHDAFRTVREELAS